MELAIGWRWRTRRSYAASRQLIVMTRRCWSGRAIGRCPGATAERTRAFPPAARLLGHYVAHDNNRDKMGVL